MSKQNVVYWKSNGIFMSQSFTTRDMCEEWAKTITKIIQTPAVVLLHSKKERFASGSLWMETIITPGFIPSEKNGEKILKILKESADIAANLAEKEKRK